MTSFTLDIITPEGHLFTGAVVAVTAPGSEGSLGVLAHHAPMICSLRPGLLTVRTEESTRLYGVGAGVLETKQDGLTILVDAAVEADTAEAAQARVQEFTSPWKA